MPRQLSRATSSWRSRRRLFYVLVLIEHGSRRLLHFNVTQHPSAEWTLQQLREAFPFEQVPRYLLRERDGIFGGEFRKDVEAMGIKEVLSARSEERRVGKKCLTQCRSRWSPYH